MLFSLPIALSFSWISSRRIFAYLFSSLLFISFLSVFLPHYLFFSFIILSSSSVRLPYQFLLPISLSLSLSLIVLPPSSFSFLHHLPRRDAISQCCHLSGAPVMTGFRIPTSRIPNLDLHSPPPPPPPPYRKWHGKHATKSATWEHQGKAPRAGPGVIYRAGRSWT